jgi:hypothetical protein
MEKIARDMREGVFPNKSKQRVRGVGRVADNVRALLMIFAVEPTDDEIRAIHDYLLAWREPPAPVPADWIENLCAHVGEDGLIGEPAARALLQEVLRLRGMANQ